MSATQTDPLIGMLVGGRYRVLRPLGEGGMGQVYLAEHEAIEKPVALKILRPEYSHKQDIVTRFQQEAISASRIKHPNVLDVFDFGKLDTGEAFLAMEFLEGHDLADELEKRGTLDAARGIFIAIQICRALAAAHARGVVHRDMKPDNVFLQRTADGEEIVKIVDFGIAQLRTTEEAAQSEPKRRRLTKTGMIFGTPEYMAPEQAAGKKADLRVDIYAVGVILYEMFTGAVPFTGDSFMAVLAATLNSAPPSLAEINPQVNVSPELQAVILRALEKNPEDRYQSMVELANAIVGSPEGSLFAGFAPGAEVRASNFPAAAGSETAALFASRRGTPGTPIPPAEVAAGTADLGTPQVARSSTQLSGESTSLSPAPAKSPGLLFGAIGFVALAGAIGVFMMGSRREGPAPAATAVAQPTPSVEPSAPVVTPVTAEEATVQPAVDTESNEVKLRIETEPEGAIITKDGYQVCAESPCDVIVDRKEAVALEARKGPYRGSAKILAQNDQTVTIQMSVVRRAKPQKKLCEVEVNGLKILRECPK